MPVDWLTVMLYGLWGMLGGALVTGLDFVSIIGRTGDWPWRARKRLRAGPYFAAIFVRLLLSAGLTLAASQSVVHFNSLTAVTIGIATPLIVEKLAKTGVDVQRGGIE